jgi:hypothetical protein
VKVYLKGGLGNQLFQFCYLHYLHGSLQSNLGIVKDSNPRLDRPFLLDCLIQFCSHAEIDSKRSPFASKFIGKVLHTRIIKGLVYRLKRSKLKFETQEYIFSPEVVTRKKNAIVVGYFQHWKYVEESWEAIGPEINNCLSRYPLPDYCLTEYLVVHIRRGDFELQSEQLGILGIDYYENAILAALASLQISRIKIYVITDQVEAAKELFTERSDLVILGPTVLDEWRCLSLMSSARAVITANSTLSWWGGYLCHKNGGLMVIPNPWFSGWAARVGSAFTCPGVLQVDSGFRGLKA